MLSREIFSGIEYGWVTYIVSFITMAVLVYAFYKKTKVWQLGIQDTASLNLISQGSKVLRNLLDQRLLDGNKSVGITHMLVFYGFIILFIGTVLLMLDSHVYHFLYGNTFITYKFILNLAGVFALIGIITLFFRRYVLKLKKDNNTLQTLLALVLPFLVLITGFLVEGSRLAISPAEHTGWEFWAFPVYPIVAALQPLSASALSSLHTVAWWIHMLLSFATILAIGCTRLSHVALAPLNMFFQANQSPGQLREIPLSDEYFGTETLSDFTNKQLISIDACVSANNCEVNCPAFNSGKTLSPRVIMEKLQTVKDYKAPLIGELVSEDEIWSCTTCGACQQKCPNLTNPVDKIIDLRRFQVLALGNMPQSWQSAMMSLQRRGHPWNAANRSRLDWAKGLNVPIAAQKKQFDVLFWVGCTGALMDRNIKVSQAIVKLLQSAGVDFAILGTEENCTCHMARRIGDEYLYQEMAEKNQATLKQYTFSTIITACPHCFHTLKNEYDLSQDGIQVISHAAYLKDLMDKGLLKTKRGLEKNITYHDPCYYGRINGIYEQPREICEQIGAKLIESEQSRNNSFCCGGGGGVIWSDDPVGSRIFEERTKQLLASSTDLIATACPFCITMLESGVSNLASTKTVKVQDIAELLVDNLQECQN